MKFIHPSYTKSERDWSHIKNTEEVKSKMRDRIQQRENRSQACAKSEKVSMEIPKQINGKRTIENRGYEGRDLEVEKKLKIGEEKSIKTMKVKAIESSLVSLKKISVKKDEKKRKLKSIDLIMEQLIEDITLSEC